MRDPELYKSGEIKLGTNKKATEYICIHITLLLILDVMWPANSSSCCYNVNTVVDYSLKLWAKRNPFPLKHLLSGCFITTTEMIPGHILVVMFTCICKLIHTYYLFVIFEHMANNTLTYVDELKLNQGRLYGSCNTWVKFGKIVSMNGNTPFTQYLVESGCVPRAPAYRFVSYVLAWPLAGC